MASTSSISGLASGFDSATVVSQLMQIEAQPQTLLKTRLTDTKADAAAYRAVNTKLDALRTAAEALTKTATWAAAKATASSTSATATAGADATPGSLTFSVTSLAANHSVLSATSWSKTTDTFGLASPLVLTNADGSTKQIALKAGATLADAVSAINGANAGVTATAVSTSTGFRLQVASSSTGASSSFTLASTGATTTEFPTLAQGVNAKLHVGGTTNGYDAESATNTFTDLMRGTPITVGTTGGPVTVTVTSDPDAVATAVQTLVTAANAALTSIDGYTDTSTGSTAVLKGDSSLRALTSKVLDTVAYAIGTDGSAIKAGLQLTRDGQITFDKDVFTAKLKSDPAVVQRLVNGTAASNPDGIVGNADDVTAAAGVAQRLLTLAKAATDSTSGTLTLLAKSEDSQATGIQAQIDDWDLRLAARKATLTAQFTAMETALSSLQNQASWLSSQIAGLPSWSSSNS